MFKVLLRLNLFFVFLLAVTAAAGQEVYTFDRCLQEAMKHNISLRQEDLALERAINDLHASRLNRIPDLNGNVNTSVNNGRALDPITYQYNTQQFLNNIYALQSSIKVFEGGKQNHTIARYSIATDIQKLKIENRKLNLTKDIFAQYAEACMLEEVASVWDEKISLLHVQKEKAQLLADNGRKTPSAVWEIEVELNRSVQYLEDVHYRREVALLKLRNLIGLPLSTPVRLQCNPAAPVIDTTGYSHEKVESIVRNTPAYKESAAQVSYADKDLQIARSTLFPSLSLGGMIGTGYSSRIKSGSLDGNNFGKQMSDNFYQNVSMSLYIPVLNRFQSHYNINRYKIGKLQSVEAQKLRTQELRELLYIQNNQLRYSGIRYQELKKGFDTYKNILNEASLNFQSGRIDTFEFLLKQQQKYTIEESLVLLKYNHFVAQKTLELFERGEVSY